MTGDRIRDQLGDDVEQLLARARLLVGELGDHVDLGACARGIALTLRRDEARGTRLKGRQCVALRRERVLKRRHVRGVAIEACALGVEIGLERGQVGDDFSPLGLELRKLRDVHEAVDEGPAPKQLLERRCA